MLLSYNRLCELVEQGVINAPIENINASSIDITLHNKIFLESPNYQIVDISQGEKVLYHWRDIGEDGFILNKGAVVLASSNETFNLPDNISAEYKLKSTMARNFLEHLNAGWCDAGWHGSRLTLELKNMTQNKGLILRENMKIGQIVFFEHEMVPEHASYRAKGQYNNQQAVTLPKELR